ncbi:hypothetical protein CXG81DRAFT_15773, partial [Caulochytrium protostelioides]
AKYVGTGHPDITKHTWMTHQHRDMLASMIGHPNLLMHTAVAENKSPGRVRIELLRRMVQPCGPPPREEDTA